MKKLLLLFAVLLGTVGAWAQTEVIEASTNVDSPEHVFKIKNANGWVMGGTTGSTGVNTTPGKFVFVAGTKEGAFKVYSLNEKRWVSYTKSSGYSNGENFAQLIESQEDAQEWNFSIVNRGGAEVYQIAPYNTTGVASKYWNYFNGVSATHNTIGLWQGGAAGDAGSAWIIEEVLQTVTFDYVFKYNGETKMSESITARVDRAYPESTLAPDFIEFSLPEGNVKDSDEGKTFEISCSYNLPFEVSNDYASAHWYALKIRDDGFTYLKYDSSKDYIPAADASYSLKSLENYLWAFIGNPFDGIKIINKAAGADKLLSAPNDPNGDKDNLARMIVGTTGNEVWNIKAPTHANPQPNVFYVQHPIANSYAFNRQGYDNTTALCYWTGRDTGSALKVEEVYDFSQFGDLLFSDEQMQEGKIYRIQSTTRKTFTGINGYTCDMQNQEYDATNPGQLWKYVKDGDKAYLQNVYAGLCPQYVNGGTNQTTAIGTSKDYAFTYSINNTNVEHIWNIFFGGRQVNIEGNGNVNWWNGENAHHYIYEEEATDEELATMCMNWYNANKYVAPEATASSYQKIAIDENATVIISPSEFAAPSVINDAIDNLAAVESELNVTVNNANDIHTLFATLSAYELAKSALTAYKNAVTNHGELLSIAYTPKAEWGTIILPINWAKPEGWTRYSCAATEGNVLSLTEYADGTTKNSPMIIQVAEDKIGTTYQLIGYSNGAGTENVKRGLLTGVLEDNTIVPDGSYVLARQKSTGKIGFFPVAEGANYGLEKYKCYLTLDPASSRYNALFFDGTETAIESVEGEDENAKAVVYDLAGRRVQNAQKGVFIVNGKVVIK